MNRIISIAIIIFVCLKSESYSCTIIMMSDSKVTLAGSNEDAPFPLTMIWFIPATEKEYGRVCLGYKMMINSVQGGMNEKGLFLDGNSVGKQGWEPDKNKMILVGSLLDRILATCATIEEVKEFFITYNIPALDQSRIPVMDKSGSSMIVEWYNGKVVFLETNKQYQIATNFIESQYLGMEKPCWRYNTADEMLRNMETFSVNFLKDVLEATHQESKYSSTVYSFICDIQVGDIYLYNYHNFSNSLKFNIKEELIKGNKEYFLGNLFNNKSEDYIKFIDEGPVNMIEFGYTRSNRMVANMFYNILKLHYPTAFDRNIDINVLSQVGKHLLEQGKPEDALIFLERNMTEFPDSARTHFELADVYLKTNKIEKAIAEYKKTLFINPYHKQADLALKNLLK